MAGKARGHLHVRKDPTTKSDNVIQLDYTYWSAAGIPGVGPERRALTSLSAVHEPTGYCMATVVERKGPWPFAVASIVKMIRDIGLEHEGKIILRGDAEPSLMALLAAVRKEVPEVEVQQAPVGSHQSIGAAEQKHDHIASQVRVMVTVIQEKAKLVIKPLTYYFHGL